jgi:hypothetical protein
MRGSSLPLRGRGAGGEGTAISLTPLAPLSRTRARGERAAPLSHCVGEGLGVRANQNFTRASGVDFIASV